MSSPHVSIIMPNYNKAQYLAPAIESVLRQTQADFELIIVDDASTDSSRNVVRRYAEIDKRVHLISRSVNGGPSAAINVGIRAARGSRVALLGSDDIYAHNKLELQLQALEGESEPTIIYSDYWQMDANGAILVPDHHDSTHGSGRILSELLECNIITATVLIPKLCFERVGLFDEGLRLGEDTDMILRLAKNYPFKFVPESLYGYRCFSDNTVNKISRRLRYRIEAAILEKHFLANFEALDPGVRSRVRKKLFTKYVASRQYGRLLKLGLSGAETLKLLVRLPGSRAKKSHPMASRRRGET